MNQVLAVLLAATHGAFIAFLVAGALLVRRHRALLRPHLAAVAATTAVFATRAHCPLTTWENHFRDAAGWPAIDGFVEHYVIGPFRPEGMTPTLQVLVAAAWMVPTAVGYGRLLAARSPAGPGDGRTAATSASLSPRHSVPPTGG
jgi:Protein of Unknown function (DUF2784)